MRRPGWRVAVIGDVERDTLGIQQLGNGGTGRCAEADRGGGALGRFGSQELGPGRARHPACDAGEVGLGPGDQGRQTTLGLGPAQAVQRVGHTQH